MKEATGARRNEVTLEAIKWTEWNGMEALEHVVLDANSTSPTFGCVTLGMSLNLPLLQYLSSLGLL